MRSQLGARCPSPLDARSPNASSLAIMLGASNGAPGRNNHFHAILEAFSSTISLRARCSRRVPVAARSIATRLEIFAPGDLRIDEQTRRRPRRPGSWRTSGKPSTPIGRPTRTCPPRMRRAASATPVSWHGAARQHDATARTARIAGLRQADRAGTPASPRCAGE